MQPSGSGFREGGLDSYIMQLKKEEAEKIRELKATLAAEKDRDEQKKIKQLIRTVSAQYKQKMKDARKSSFSNT